MYYLPIIQSLIHKSFPLGNTLELTITHVDNSSYLSFLDETIDKFNYWLRRLFRREPYSSSNSSINDISSIQSPRDSSNNAHIVMTDEDSFGEGSSVPVASRLLNETHMRVN